jgi:pimeloyl-ACP methyl ester carboxylesterase
MFSAAVTNDRVGEFAASLTEFHPAGFRAMALACAADLREVLPQVQVPTLLLYGDQDVRAPLSVGQALHAAIPNSKLAIMPGAGHVSTVEAAEQFNMEVRQFLRPLNDYLAESQKSDRLP